LPGAHDDPHQGLEFQDHAFDVGSCSFQLMNPAASRSRFPAAGQTVDLHLGVSGNKSRAAAGAYLPSEVTDFSPQRNIMISNFLQCHPPAPGVHVQHQSDRLELDRRHLTMSLQR